MPRPPRRRALPRRQSNNDKRRLLPEPPSQLIESLLEAVTYAPSSKHKRNPHLYGLPPFDGPRGDATLCDEHASFQPAQMREIPSLVQRGIRAGLLGATQRVIWTVADNGWIYEGRQTNADTSEFHGYPVRESEPIAELVYQRFVAWVDEHGDSSARHAAMSCRQRYGFH